MSQQGTSSNGKSAIVDSWNTEEELNSLMDLKRRNQLVPGVIRTVVQYGNRTVIEPDSGEEKVVRAEIAVVALINGTTGYCPIDKFSTREFKSLRQFVGRKVDFYIDQIRTDLKQVLLDGKAAQQKKVEDFWKELEEYQKEGILHEKTFKGIVTGLHSSHRSVFVNVEGQDALIPRTEWSHNPRDILTVAEGEEVKVKIAQANFETRRLMVSRKETLPDPFEFLSTLERGSAIAGRVAQVHPVYGISVMLENGVTVKAKKLKELEEPVVDEMVNCTVIKEIRRREDGRTEGRVVITGYPQGKRKMRDLGSFLFS